MKTHQQIAKDAIGFAARPVTAQEWEKIKQRELGRKAAKMLTKHCQHCHQTVPAHGSHDCEKPAHQTL